MKQHISTYSSIISPEEYNHLMTDEHLYISDSDNIIKKFIEEESTKHAEPMEVVEFGCGPGRVLQLIATISNIHLTGIDHDENFVEYARNLLLKKKLKANVVLSDIGEYKNQKPVDIFYSQGVHHHIEKGEETAKYLNHVYGQLKIGGAFIISDEFIPEYKDKTERRIRLVIWYSHIIANAKKLNHDFLAQEEAKTLLDDLNENEDAEAVKNTEQLELVLGSVDAIDSASTGGDVNKAESLAKNLLDALDKMRNVTRSGNETIDLSRGDYKISDSEFRKEVENVGFKIEKVEAVGPIKTIGGLVVYLLRK